jgi:hypothetical protein
MVEVAGKVSCGSGLLSSLANEKPADTVPSLLARDHGALLQGARALRTNGCQPLDDVLPSCIA